MTGRLRVAWAFSPRAWFRRPGAGPAYAFARERSEQAVATLCDAADAECALKHVVARKSLEKVKDADGQKVLRRLSADRAPHVS